jgi:hypothetical protein
MVSTEDLARLVRVTEEAQAQLVLVGDDHQLAPVGAGGLFRLLAADAVELESVRRFVEPWEAEASLRLRRGDPTVVARYAEHGRVTGGTRDEVITAALDAWESARARGESVVVLARDRATVEELNLAARARRRQAEDVGPAAVRLRAHGDAHAWAHGGVHGAFVGVGVGDEVVTAANDRRLVTPTGAWVRNGDRWVVSAVGNGGALQVESLADGGSVVLPPAYAASSVDLGYALTVHKAQGLTVDRSVAVLDETAAAEVAYVALTRGRLENRALVVSESGQRPEEVLASVVNRSGASASATQVLREELDRTDDLAVLVPQLEDVRARIDAEAGPDRTAALRTLRALATYEAEERRRQAAERRARWTPAEAQALAAGERQLVGLRRRRWRHRDHEATMRLANRVAQLRDLRDRAEEAGRMLSEPSSAGGGQLWNAEAAQRRREDWLRCHPEEGRCEAALAERVAARRRALAAVIEAEPPPHLVRLLGPPPTGGARRQEWLGLAERLEVHREQWRIAPGNLGRRPVRAEAAREWTVLSADLDRWTRPSQAVRRRRTLDRGLGLEW